MGIQLEEASPPHLIFLFTIPVADLETPLKGHVADEEIRCRGGPVWPPAIVSKGRAATQGRPYDGLFENTKKNLRRGWR